jgi:hypothetical protein
MDLDSGHRRRAEARLRQRSREHARLHIAPLPEPARLEYIGRWRTGAGHRASGTPQGGAEMNRHGDGGTSQTPEGSAPLSRRNR